MGFFRKIAHIGSSSSHHNDEKSAPVIRTPHRDDDAGSEEADDRRRGRSRSPFGRSRSRDSQYSSKRDESAEGIRRGDYSEVESDTEDVQSVVPSNAFDNSGDEEDSDEWSEPDEDDLMLERNTEVSDRDGRAHTTLA
jgi:hypothetical protein